MTRRWQGRGVAPGEGRGEALVSPLPLSFYGGVDPRTGVVIEPGHPLEGRCVAGRVLAFPSGKGSTVGSYVLYGLARHGLAPAAIVNRATETIVATGAILGGIPCVDGIEVDELVDGEPLRVDGEAGTVEGGEGGERA